MSATSLLLILVPDLNCTVKKPDSEDRNTWELVSFIKHMKERQLRLTSTSA